MVDMVKQLNDDTLVAVALMPQTELRTTVAKHDEKDPLGLEQPVD